jgi:hypothetical protein
VTANFIDRVSELCDEVGGDPGALIETLASSKFGFRNNKRGELETYLIDNGFIDTTSPLTADEIRLRVMAHVEDAMSSLHLTAGDVDELIGYVLAGDTGIARAGNSAS